MNKEEILKKIKNKTRACIKKIIRLFMIALVFAFCVSLSIFFIYEKTGTVPKDNKKINVIVKGVDNGLMHGYACEWGEGYAYYDNGGIYYYADNNADQQIIDCQNQQPKQLATNDKYLFCLHESNIIVSDTHITETVSIGNYLFYGINIYPDEVLLDTNYDEEDDYEMSETELNMLEKYEIKLFSDEKNCINRYDSGYVYYCFDGKSTFIFDGYGYGHKKSEDEFEDKIYYDETVKGNRRDLSPRQTTVNGKKIYMLIQIGNYYKGQTRFDYVDYKNKNYDLLVCFDSVTETCEIIYKTPQVETKKEQIVNFSVENNQMFLLVEGILYKTDLHGNSRVELASYVDHDNLAFDYANDTLFVYESGKLLGQYR